MKGLNICVNSIVKRIANVAVRARPDQAAVRHVPSFLASLACG